MFLCFLCVNFGHCTGYVLICPRFELARDFVLQLYVSYVKLALKFSIVFACLFYLTERCMV